MNQEITMNTILKEVINLGEKYKDGLINDIDYVKIGRAHV